MEENYTKRVLENLLNSSSSIISRYDLSLKLGAISLLLDFQNVEKHIEETIKNIESLTPFDGIFDVDLLHFADELEKISFNKEFNTKTDLNLAQPGYIIDLLFPGELIDKNRDKANSIRGFLSILSSELSIEDISNALSEIKAILVKELRKLYELLNNNWDDNYYIKMTDNLFDSCKNRDEDGYFIEPIHDNYLKWKRSSLYNPVGLEMRLWKEVYDLLMSGFIIVNDEYYLVNEADRLFKQTKFDLLPNKNIQEEELKMRFFFLSKFLIFNDRFFVFNEKARFGRYLKDNRHDITKEMFMKFFGFINVQKMIIDDMEKSKPSFSDIDDSLPESYLKADKEVFTDTMKLANGTIVNTRSQVKKVADKNNMESPNSIGLFKLLCDEAGALKGDINDMIYVRALIAIHAIPFKEEKEIKRITGSYQKKTNGHTRKGKTIPPIDKEHIKWKGNDKNFGEKVYKELLEIKK